MPAKNPDLDRIPGCGPVEDFKLDDTVLAKSKHGDRPRNARPKKETREKQLEEEKKKCADNIEQFFKDFDFGKELEKNSEPYRRHKVWGMIYRVTKNMPEYGLKKGDQFFLDTSKQHGASTGNHLEIFRGSHDNNMRQSKVLDLFGRKIETKTNAAMGRPLW